jgi:aryl-alcohol dehydrogenase-like predicted oxidoreductase
MTSELDNRSSNVAGISLNVSRVGLGTWAIGGPMWGGTDEEEPVQTMRAAGERGVNLIYPRGTRGGPLR